MAGERDRAALLIAATCCLVLVVIVADLILRSGPAEQESIVGAYAALGSIGLALSVGIARWIGRGGDDGPEPPDSVG